MRYLKLMELALTAMFALGISTAGSASAISLPEIEVALSGAYPLHVEVTVLIGVKLSNPVEALEAKTLLLLYLTSASGSLGTFEELWQGYENEKGTKCNSAGDPRGEVLMKGSFHVVFVKLPGGSYSLGILLLVEPLTIECGTTKPKWRGTVLSSLEGVTSETTEYTELKDTLTGNGKGAPTLKTYLTDAGTPAEVKFESNFGTGYKESAEEIEGQVTSTALEGKMFAVSNITAP